MLLSLHVFPVSVSTDVIILLHNQYGEVKEVLHGFWEYRKKIWPTLKWMKIITDIFNRELCAEVEMFSNSVSCRQFLAMQIIIFHLQTNAVHSKNNWFPCLWEMYISL